MTLIKHNWSHQEIKDIYELPLLDLINKSSNIHREFHDSTKMNMNTLVSVRTGACSQDCKYCAQSSFYKTDLKAEKLNLSQVLVQARIAQKNGVKRVCLSSSGRDANNAKRFDEMAEMITEVKKMGLEVCCTMGMINLETAHKLADLGITAVNHNIDTSERHYKNITTTRTYADRLETLGNLQKAGIQYCSGGILGMGETDTDRIEMLRTLANQPVHPYNVPLNSLVPVKGTPFYGKEIISVFEMARVIATARVLMPKAVIAFAAGRTHYSAEGQAFCFLAGANSIFFGNKLLTVDNMLIDEDQHLINTLGMKITKYEESTNLQESECLHECV